MKTPDDWKKTLKEFSPNNSFSKSLEKKLGKIAIPTNVPGVVIDVTPKLVVKFNGTVEISVSYAPIFGFKYDTDNGCQNISQYGLRSRAKYL